MLRLDDTIAAVASAAAGAARGIVRISGAGARECVAAWFDLEDERPLEELRHATAVAGKLRLPGLNAPLPCTLYYWPNERSYTRQPVIEVHTLGSPPLVQRVLQAVCAKGARPAEPGEFTLRAFLAGRLDLTQAEAVLGVIDATGRRDFQVALAQLAGGLAGPLAELRGSLLDLLAHLEAGLDFVGEDIEFISAAELRRQLAAATEQVERLAEQTRSRLETAEAPRVVLTGWPNVGKSSLFNALAGRAEALVSDQAGTTRDYLTAEVDCEGLPCQLVDTAGADPGSAGIAAAAEAQRAGQQQAAHVEILCLDATRPLNAWERAQLAHDCPQRIVVLTKADLVAEFAGIPPVSDPVAEIARIPPGQFARFAANLRSSGEFRYEMLSTSSRTGMGLARLKRRIREVLESAAAGGVVAATALRCRDSLRLASECLGRAGDLAQGESGDELIAAELRVALEALGQVAGAVYTDDLLDRIFSRFCIGK
jgi:tRNA modification GTPase